MGARRSGNAGSCILPMFIAIGAANLRRNAQWSKDRRIRRYMNQRLKILSPWAQLGLFMVLFGGCFILGSLIFLIVPGKPIGMAKLQLALSSAAIFGLPAYLYAVMTSGEKPLPFLGFKRP